MGDHLGHQCTALVFPNFTLTFNKKEHISSCELKLCTVALNYKSHLDGVTMNHQTKYLGQRSFVQKLPVSRHQLAHTHTYNRLLYTATKVVSR